MKKLLCLLLGSLVISAAAAEAQIVQLGTTLATPESLEPSIAKKGEKFRLQTVTKLADEPGEVTVVGFGPKAWVLVEYDRAFSRRNATGALEDVKEKVQLWVNFDHVIAAKRIVPEPAK